MCQHRVGYSVDKQHTTVQHGRLPTVATFFFHACFFHARLEPALIARTQAKHTKQLFSPVPAETILANLGIVDGSIRDISIVKSALLIKDTAVDMIVSGIGSVMDNHMDPIIC